jgi:hypothetical protein
MPPNPLLTQEGVGGVTSISLALPYRKGHPISQFSELETCEVREHCHRFFPDTQAVIIHLTRFSESINR